MRNGHLIHVNSTHESFMSGTNVNNNFEAAGVQSCIMFTQRQIELNLIAIKKNLMFSKQHCNNFDWLIGKMILLNFNLIFVEKCKRIFLFKVHFSMCNRDWKRLC